MLRIIVLFISIISIVGCASSQPVLVVDQMFRSVPQPHYVLSVAGTQMQVLFYYASYVEKKDLDGGIIKVPTYLDLMKVHTIDNTKIKEVDLTVEVKNPGNIEYTLDLDETITGKKVITFRQGPLHKSNQVYRKYTFPLKLESDSEIDHCIILHINGCEIMRIGPFRYKIT